MKKVLVTGAFGFVGPHLMQCLQAAHDRVIAHHFTPLAADAVTFDLCDRSAVREVIRELCPDGIVHLAAQSSVKSSWDDPGATFSANLTGTVHLLEAVRDFAPKCRVVTIGSAEEYASPAGDQPLTESSLCDPGNPYALSKYAVSILIRQFVAAYGLQIVHARPFNHIGPGQRDGFVVPNFAAQLAAIQQGLRPPVLEVGNLTAVRDFTDVRDVVVAYRLLLERGEPGTIYNIASGQGLSIRELLERMIALVNQPITIKVDAARLRPIDVPVLVGDATRLRAGLGWAPRYTLDATLTDVLRERQAIV